MVAVDGVGSLMVALMISGAPCGGVGEVCRELLRGAGAQIAGEGTCGGGEDQIEDESQADAGEENTCAKLWYGEHVEGFFRGWAGGREDGGVHLGEEVGQLDIDLRDGVEDVALEDEVDGVEGDGADEDGEAGEKAELCAKSGGDADQPKAGAVDTEGDDGRGDEPEKRKKADGGKHEGKKGQQGSDSSGKGGAFEGTGPGDGVAWRRRLQDGVEGRIGGGLLRVDLVGDLLAKLFG